jgi:hypothetical protein
VSTRAVSRLSVGGAVAHDATKKPPPAQAAARRRRSEEDPEIRSRCTLEDIDVRRGGIAFWTTALGNRRRSGILTAFRVLVLP